MCTLCPRGNKSEGRRSSSEVLTTCSGSCILRAAEQGLRLLCHAPHWQVTSRALATLPHVPLPSGNNHVSHTKCKASHLLHVCWCGSHLLWHRTSKFLVSGSSTAKQEYLSLRTEPIRCVFGHRRRHLFEFKGTRLHFSHAGIPSALPDAMNCPLNPALFKLRFDTATPCSMF